MAHRCNTIKWFDHAIEWGANGIEADVIKDYDGKIYTWHGELGAGWEHLDVYLDNAYTKLQSGNDGAKVSLMIFDLKYDARGKIKADDITSIRKMVWEKLLEPLNRGRPSFDKGGFYVFYVVYDGDDYAGEFEKSMAAMPIQPREGTNYDANLEISPDVALEWKAKVGIEAFFYSSGIFSGGTSSTMWKQLEAAVELRKSNVFGVYGWTFNRAQSAANSIKDTGCDAVLGNMDHNYGWLPDYLDYYGLVNYNLADRDGTPPFMKLRN